MYERFVLCVSRLFSLQIVLTYIYIKYFSSIKFHYFVYIVTKLYTLTTPGIKLHYTAVVLLYPESIFQ